MATNPKRLASSLSKQKGSSQRALVTQKAITARLIEWRDGIPVVVTRNVIPAEQVPDLAMAALSAPFKDDLGLFPEYEGMSNLEVAFLQASNQAALGSLDHLNAMLNRGVGLPKSTSTIRKLDMTYQDLLDAIAREEERNAPGKIIDTDAVTMPDEDPE